MFEFSLFRTLDLKIPKSMINSFIFIFNMHKKEIIFAKVKNSLSLTSINLRINQLRNLSNYETSCVLIN